MAFVPSAKASREERVPVHTPRPGLAVRAEQKPYKEAAIRVHRVQEAAKRVKQHPLQQLLLIPNQEMKKEK